MDSLVQEKNSNFQRDNYMLNNMLKKEDLINAGSHYGHPASKWHPNYKEFIIGKKNGIHIIDVDATLNYLNVAMKEMLNVVKSGGNVLFVGTKAQALDAVVDSAESIAIDDAAPRRKFLLPNFIFFLIFFPEIKFKI